MATDANWVNNTGGYGSWQDWWMQDPLAASMSRTNDAFASQGLSPYYNTGATLDPYYGGGGGQIIDTSSDTNRFPTTNTISGAVNTPYQQFAAGTPFFNKDATSNWVYDSVYPDGGPYGSYENYMDQIKNPMMTDGYQLFPTGADGFRPEGPAYGSGVADLSGIYAQQQAYAAQHPEMAWQPGTAGITGGGTTTGGTSGGSVPPVGTTPMSAPTGGTTGSTTGSGTMTGTTQSPGTYGGLGTTGGSYGTNLSNNPYLTGMADDISRRTQQMLGQNNNAIAGQAIGMGGLGGARQGVQQGLSGARAADYLQGNLAGLYSGAWNNQANRDLQRYGYDQNFYTAQRGQDLAGTALGANIYTQGVQGGWIPIDKAASAYGNFTGFGNTTSTTDSGGGTSGLIGGLLSGATLGKNMGWW